MARQSKMSDQRPVRSTYINVRVLPALRERIKADAHAQGVSESVIVRRIVAGHYTKQ
jgi:hypothetical protein